MDVVEGQVLAGKYRIERVLGRGGMGVVVAATHLQLGERVALKFLLAEALDNAEAVARFNREARAAVRIKSEHVARVSDVGTLENGAPFMVMEYLEGADLAAWLRQRGPLPIEQAVEFVLQACEAIAEAHTLGIVHRDLKPANLFVIELPDGALAVKVLDFGISKSTGLASSGAGVTRTSTTLGSPLYMPPEQMQSAKDVDARGDIWALGVVLYELLSGHIPFPGETMTELVLKVVNGAPVPLRAVRFDAPVGLEAVVLKCLEKERSARYQTVAELAAALSEFGPRHSKASVERIARVMQRGGFPAASTPPPATPHALEAASTIPQTLASWGQTQSAPKRARWMLIAAALVAVPSLAGAAIAWLRSSEHGPEHTSATASLGATALPRSAEPPASEESAPATESAAVIAAESSSPTPRAPAAASTPGAAWTPAKPAAAKGRAGTPVSNRTSRAPQPTAADATAVASKPATSPAGKNPLKMSLQ